jgi:hypothetical protein
MSIVKLNNRGVKNATAFGSITGLGGLAFISRSTISSGTSTVSITSGINSTYKEYLFVFNNFHLSNDNAQPSINFSIDSGSNYNVTKTTTNFSASHHESDSATLLGYNGSWDLAQATTKQYLSAGTGSDNDQSASGFLRLFDPSNTTFVKHFIAVMNSSTSDDSSQNLFIAGYGNTTSAIDAVQFAVSAGTLDSGTIDLYGIK